jgi:hypothetical protein
MIRLSCLCLKILMFVVALVLKRYLRRSLNVAGNLCSSDPNNFHYTCQRHTYLVPSFSCLSWVTIYSLGIDLSFPSERVMGYRPCAPPGSIIILPPTIPHYCFSFHPPYPANSRKRLFLVSQWFAAMKHTFHGALSGQLDPRTIIRLFTPFLSFRAC